MVGENPGGDLTDKTSERNKTENAKNTSSETERHSDRDSRKDKKIGDEGNEGKGAKKVEENRSADEASGDCLKEGRAEKSWGFFAVEESGKMGTENHNAGEGTKGEKPAKVGKIHRIID